MLNECISPALLITFSCLQLHYFGMCLLLSYFRISKWEEITKSSLKTNKNETHGYIGFGKSSTFERVELFLYHFLSSLSKFKQYSGSTQTFAATEAKFDLTRLMFGLFFACQIYVHTRLFMKSEITCGSHNRPEPIACFFFLYWKDHLLIILCSAWLYLKLPLCYKINPTYPSRGSLQEMNQGFNAEWDNSVMF